MASVIGGRNNCPTSERDGICIDPRVNRQTVEEIERTNGHVFAPKPVDIAVRDARDKAAMFLSDDTFDQRLALSMSVDEYDRAELRAEIADRELSLETMEPTMQDILSIENED